MLRRFLSSSALYVTGNKGQNTVSVVVPYLEFEHRIRDKNELRENIKARKLNFSLDRVQKKWTFHKTIEDTKENLEAAKHHVTSVISELMKLKTEASFEEIGRLKFYAKIIKEDLKNVKEYVYCVEENAAIAALSLPNVLHTETPRNFSQVVYESSNKPTQKSKHHMEIAQSQGLLTVSNKYCLYLKKQAALFEISNANFWSKSLLGIGFTKLSNPYFCRSVVLEGIGKNHEFDTLTLETKQDDSTRIHLTGGSSLAAFMAYLTRHLINENCLPLQLYTVGKYYSPLKGEPVSLFNSMQETQISVFIATLDDNNLMNNTFAAVLNIFKNLCNKLSIHFRIVYVSAPHLEIEESLRASIEMFSNSEGKYIEVGKIAIYDSYLSKRLLLVYNKEKERKFCKIVGGSFSVQKMFGCILENKYVTNEPLLCSTLLKYCPFV